MEILRSKGKATKPLTISLRNIYISNDNSITSSTCQWYSNCLSVAMSVNLVQSTHVSAHDRSAAIKFVHVKKS